MSAPVAEPSPARKPQRQRRPEQTAAQIIAGVQARLDRARSVEERQRIIASANRTNDYRWAKRQQAHERELKRAAVDQNGKRSSAIYHARKRAIEEARWYVRNSEKFPVLPVAIAAANIEQGRLTGAQYRFALWLIARAPATRPGVWTDGFGTYRIEQTAFDLSEDFGGAGAMARIRSLVRTSKSAWSRALIRLPNRGLVPMIESVKVVRSQVGPGHAIEFTLAPAIDSLATARNADFSRKFPYCRYSPEIAAGMETYGELRFYVWCAVHRGGVFRHWHASPLQLRQVLGLPLHAHAGHIERSLDRAIAALPKSITLRPQWSPLKSGGRIRAYEFQLVPIFADIRRLVWRYESVAAAEDHHLIRGNVNRAFQKSVDEQIKRYRRNVKRVEDADRWYLKWTGRRFARRAAFELALETLQVSLQERLDSAPPTLIPLRKFDELDVPRRPGERYAELPLPLPPAETYGLALV